MHLQCLPHDRRLASVECISPPWPELQSHTWGGSRHGWRWDERRLLLLPVQLHSMPWLLVLLPAPLQHLLHPSLLRVQGSGLDLCVHFRRQTRNFRSCWCHLEGSSGFPEWKQPALKVIMGQKACSGVRPSIYKQRLPFLPGDRTTQGRHTQSH